MKKICFLLSGFQTSGGIERATSTLANELCKRQFLDVYTIAYIDNHQPRFFSLSEEIHQYALYNKATNMRDALLKKHAVKLVRQIIQREKIDILIACGALYYPLGCLATWGTSTECWCWEHTNPGVSCDHRFQMLARKFGIRFGDRLIVLTKAAEKQYRTELHAKAEKIVQIYNLGTDILHPKAYNSESKKIISVGRLSYPKNFDLLIDIAAEVLPKNPGWAWDIYGDGEDREKLQQKIDLMGISSQLTLKGTVNDLNERYAEYAFMVMTSRYEGFPMALLEGLSAGLPLVSFDIKTGPNEMVDNGINGFLISPLDADTMIEKVNLLIGDKGLRQKLSLSALEKAETFAAGSVLRQWENLLNVRAE